MLRVVDGMSVVCLYACMCVSMWFGMCICVHMCACVSVCESAACVFACNVGVCVCVFACVCFWFVCMTCFFLSICLCA